MTQGSRAVPTRQARSSQPEGESQVEELRLFCRDLQHLLKLMGRYAQGRRRGGSAAPVVLLFPPPAPNVRVTGDHLWQDSNGDGDVGGFCRLFKFDDVLENWVEVDTQAWADPFDWGLTSLLVPGVYRATEIGNGVNYLGESDPGPDIEVP